MFKKILITFFVILALIAFMILFAPAKTLINYAKSEFPQQLNTINFTGVSGTIWDTKVQQVNVDQFSLDNVELNTSFLSLLSGTLKSTVSIQDPNLQLQGVVQAYGQTVEAHDLNATLNPAMFDPVMQFPMLGVAGAMQVKLEKMVVNNGWPTEIQGTASWNNSLIRYLDRETKLGNFKLKLFSQDNELHLKIIENKGPLDIQGFIKILPNKTYYLDITTVQVSNGHQDILKFIKRFAKVENGRYRIRWQGPLQAGR